MDRRIFTPALHSFAAVLTLLVLSSCSDGVDPVAPRETPDATPAAIAVTSPIATPLAALGETTQLTAEGRNAAGVVVAITPTWSSSDPAVATVNESGLVTAVGDGSATISATAAGVSGGVEVTVEQVATRLVVASQPAVVTEGEVPAEPFVVHVLDARDNLVANHSETVTLFRVSPGFDLIILGTLGVTPVGGVATFDDLILGSSGFDLVFQAESAGLAVAVDPVRVLRPRLGLRTFEAASLVIGQPDKTSRIGQSSLTIGYHNNPFHAKPGTDGVRLYVPDPSGARILGYRSFPTSDGAPPDFVMGAASMAERGPFTATDTTFRPEAVQVADGRLFAVDGSNNRVLIWNSLPDGNEPADVVVGQVDFESRVRGRTVTTLNDPIDLVVAGGRLMVLDQSSHRILIWNEIPTENGAPADVVVGQPDFTSAISGESDRRMDRPAHLWSDGVRMAVVDQGNHRVLLWNQVPTTNDEPADFVLGADAFTRTVPADATAAGMADMLQPRGVTSDGQDVYVTDGFHNRVMIFGWPTENGAEAHTLLGQTAPGLDQCNDPDQDGVGSLGDISARTFCIPAALHLHEDRLFVVDVLNLRLMVFEAGGRGER